MAEQMQSLIKFQEEQINLLLELKEMKKAKKRIAGFPRLELGHLASCGF